MVIRGLISMLALGCIIVIVSFVLLAVDSIINLFL